METNWSKQKKRVNEKNSKSITIDGVTYSSLVNASRGLDVSTTAIHRMYREAVRSGLSGISVTIQKKVTYNVSVPKDKK